MAHWRKRAQWLRGDFQSPSRHTERLLDQLLNFLNGDTRGDTLTHWCLTSDESGKPCCKNDQDSWNKLVSLLTPFLTKGYPVPLLYRMKHYGPAASYIRVGCCLHRLLPRVLAVDQAGIKAADTPGSHLCQVVDALLADNNPVQPDQVLSESDFQVLVSNLLDEDKNYALQNSTRRQMVQRELIKPSFHQASIIIDILVQRVEPGINFFLRRTRVLYDLQYLSNANEEFQKLKDESKARFLKVIRGSWARNFYHDT